MATTPLDASDQADSDSEQLERWPESSAAVGEGLTAGQIAVAK